MAASTARDNNVSFIDVHLSLKVYDEQAFRSAARVRALDDNLSDGDAAEYLSAAAKSLGDCAVMLFDPGLGPDGCSILESGSCEGSSLLE